ncbi:MAG: N-acetylneuraminate synthase [Bacteroidota bacterium]
MWDLKGHTIIIAEAGVNHNGDMAIARQLIDAAAEAGADYVKFQSFKAEKLVSETAALAEYQKINTGNDTQSQFEMLKKLELSEPQHHELKAYAAKKNIKFLSTAFDTDYVGFLNDLGIDFFKVPSGEITNLPYLETIAATKKPVVLSTGMADMAEIKEALAVFYALGYAPKDMVVLQCNTQYPTLPTDVNLNAMLSIHNECGVAIGYSDHTLGLEASLAAVAMGAIVIEKHFTTDKQLPGPDHAASLDPQELKQMVQSIRIIEQMMGSAIKQPTASELPNKKIARKSIHAAKDLPIGSNITMGDLMFLRPGEGISPMQYKTLLGKTTKQSISKGHLIKWEDIE